MSRRRWPLWLGPPIALLAAAAVVSQFQAGAEAGGRRTSPPAGACAASPVATDASGKPNRAAGAGAWWKLQDRLDLRGTLIGRQLFAGRHGAISAVIDLSAESAASGPAGGVIVVASDDGRHSEIRLISALDGCSWLVHQSGDVVRGAILDPIDGSVLAHLVDRVTRADLGTWRFGAPGALTKPAQVAAALVAPAGFGPVFVTDLLLDQAGTSLAVQSCGESECLTRIFKLAGLAADTILLKGAGQGAAIGFAGAQLLTWARCAGFPCGVQRWNLETAAQAPLFDGAVGAAVTPNGRYLVVSTGTGGHTIRIDLKNGGRVALRGLGASDQLLGAGVAAFAGLQLDDDEIAVTSPGANPRSFRPAAAEVIP